MYNTVGLTATHSLDRLEILALSIWMIGMLDCYICVFGPIESALSPTLILLQRRLSSPVPSLFPSGTMTSLASRKVVRFLRQLGASLVIFATLTARLFSSLKIKKIDLQN